MIDAERPDGAPLHEFAWDEVVPLLMKAKALKSGLWQVGVRLRFAAINTVEPDGRASPAAFVGVESVTLNPATKPGPLVFDAATGLSRFAGSDKESPQPAKTLARKPKALAIPRRRG
jgi:hypothetical protein